ncbi:MAG: zinc ribbon domain-containing protein [Gammaproteobacteria bacterium]|uniref:FmdB family zinc ribbon protein n=1 Tax=Rhodoferax sp. TaxID=50421 RepID=UPI00181213B2|nr:FmdB family zinc ribbon protein [Rhodoferax sp.]MBU3897392.1 zinc ribbon domain-containing protein [Gammaproteobacteria bacterium]MBA3057148.1 zinc ribbon domain-containing protein [Rhodoferax sp.]MBU3999271.1 zinc ribbon domain-containing protein [Gammaproteobacteria bacterium]MBU4018738.1 zinc ribbon domain-containing protein [Gammaproteobacteria bacterium]MBU4079693.1 zinc ribbon domain-containing protein [Gammaproteobacteria bacterium]
MPIYAYKCESCGFTKDVLQKMSDARLTECPSCGASSFQKQLTSAGFQLKGSGWYATDFKGAAPAIAATDTATPGADCSPSTAATPEVTKPSESATPKQVAAPAAASTGGCAGGCACH